MMGTTPAQLGGTGASAATSTGIGDDHTQRRPAPVVAHVTGRAPASTFLVDPAHRSPTTADRDAATAPGATRKHVVTAVVVRAIRRDVITGALIGTLRSAIDPNVVWNQNARPVKVGRSSSVDREGFEPSKLSQQIYSLPPLAAWVPIRVKRGD